MSSWIMRRATPHDWPEIAALLATADLPLAHELRNEVVEELILN